MERSQIQRIVDSFYVGQLENFWELDNSRFVVQTSQGLYGFIKSDARLPYTDPKLDKKINKLFKTQHGQLVHTLLHPQGDTQTFIPITHKYDYYFYCLKL